MCLAQPKHGAATDPQAFGDLLVAPPVLDEAAQGLDPLVLAQPNGTTTGHDGLDCHLVDVCLLYTSRCV